LALLQIEEEQRAADKINQKLSKKLG